MQIPVVVLDEIVHTEPHRGDIRITAKSGTQYRRVQLSRAVAIKLRNLIDRAIEEPERLAAILPMVDFPARK